MVNAGAGCICRKRIDARDVIINTAGGIIGLMIQKAIKIACINNVKAKDS